MGGDLLLEAPDLAQSPRELAVERPRPLIDVADVLLAQPELFPNVGIVALDQGVLALPFVAFVFEAAARSLSRLLALEGRRERGEFARPLGRLRIARALGERLDRQREFGFAGPERRGRAGSRGRGGDSRIKIAQGAGVGGEVEPAPGEGETVSAEVFGEPAVAEKPRARVGDLLRASAA